MITATSSNNTNVIRPFSEFNGRHEFVEYYHEAQINMDLETWTKMHLLFADYINGMIPGFKNHDELIANFQEYEFDNEKIDFDWMLDNIRKTYSVKELVKQLRQSGMTTNEIRMVLASIYEENFLMLIGGEGHLFLNLRFREYNKNHATKILTLYWRDGFFFTQVPPM